VKSPVDPYLIDPLGRAIGIDPTTGEMVNTIPRATYTGPASEPQIIRIPSDSLVPGEYQLEMVAIDKGRYEVEVEVREGQLVDGVIDKSLLSSTKISGRVTEGNVVTAVVGYDDEAGQVTVINHSGGSGGMSAWIWVIVILGIIVIVASVIMIKKRILLREG
jgi:hypothetical protein